MKALFLYAVMVWLALCGGAANATVAAAPAASAAPVDAATQAQWVGLMLNRAGENVSRADAAKKLRDAPSVLPEVVEAAIVVVRDRSNDQHLRVVRQMALGIVGKHGATNPKAVPVVLEVIKESDWYMRYEALGILGTIALDDERTHAVTQALLRDPQKEVRWLAIRTLSGMAKPPKNLGTLFLDGLKDTEAEVRTETARTIAKLALQDNVDDLEVSYPALVPLVKDASPDVRLQALEAIGALVRIDEIDGKEAAPVIAMALAEKELPQLKAALNALSKTRKHAEPATKTVVGFLAHEDAEVRALARQVLSRIDTLEANRALKAARQD